MSAPSDPWHCTLCTATCTVEELEEHFSTQDHQEYLYRHTAPSQTWLCELCNDDVEGGLAEIENHLRTPEHKEKCKEQPGFYLPPAIPPTDAPSSDANDTAQPLPPTSTPPPVPSTATTSPTAVNSGWGNWWCGVCESGMQIENKESHLRGKNHLKKLRAASASAGIPVQTGASPSPPLSTPSAPHLNTSSPSSIWVCELCQRSMQLEQRDIHLQGSDHIKRLRILNGDPGAAQWTCGVCERSMQIDQREAHLRGTDHIKKEKNRGVWYCVVCNGLMQAGQKEEHLRGAYHLSHIPPGQPDPANPTPSLSQSPPPSADGDSWHCEVCNRTMQPNQRELHEGGLDHIKRLHPKPVGEWRCEPCGRTMAIDSKQMHEGGLAHIKAVARAQQAQLGLGGTWSCEVCGRTMQAEQRVLHLGGQEHLKAVRRRELMANAQADATGGNLPPSYA